MAENKTNIFEKAIVILTVISLIILGTEYYEITNPDKNYGNPFQDYYNNSGIIKILISYSILKLLFITCFLIIQFKTYEKLEIIKRIYLIIAILIGILNWFELYYGSTFYYGEVRDKQGLMFPIYASLMFTLVIFKVNYSKKENVNFILKIILAIILNSSLILFWEKVYEKWNLWQS